jgi:hypothetical protein
MNKELYGQGIMINRKIAIPKINTEIAIISLIYIKK